MTALPLWLLGCAAPCPTPWTAGMSPDSDAFSHFVVEHLEQMDVAGASFVLLRDGQPYWNAGFGVSDASSQQPVTDDTLFMLASISKLFTATTVMQQVDLGRLSLDAPAENSLPFELRHPFSTVPITPRQLLDHRAGLDDNDDLIWGAYVEADSEEALSTYLADYLVPGGSTYDTANFTVTDPGDEWLYSNIGYAALGLIAETAAREDFGELSNREVLSALHLDGGWRLRDVDEDRLAHPHRRTAFGFHSLEHYGYPDYPDGQLRMTAADLGTFLGSFYDGTAPISDASRDVLWHETTGFKSRELEGYTLRGHGGSDIGVHTQAWVDPDTGHGFVMLTNTRLSTDVQKEARSCLESGLIQTANVH